MTLREASERMLDALEEDHPSEAGHCAICRARVDLRAALAHPPETALREAPLPELPTARFSVLHNDSPFGAPRDLSVYTAEQMQEYARAALAHPPEPSVELLAWAYGKLMRMSFSKMDDALMMDRIKLLLEHGVES